MLAHLAQLARDGGILQVRGEVLEPEDAFNRQSMEMLKDGEGRGGQLAEALSFFWPGEPSRNRPLEQRHPFLGGHGLEQGQHPVFFHGLDDNERVGGADQGAEIMHGRGEGHRSVMLPRGSQLTKQRDD